MKNNMPLSCDQLDVLLFADDTNVTAMGKLDAQAGNHIRRLNQWLNSNKLVLNIDKTIQLNIKITNASLSRFQFDSSNGKFEAVCKYLGVLIDRESSFCVHVDLVKTNLSKQCGIVTKLRHYVQTTQRLQVYKSNINLVLQYGVLVYGCYSFTSLTEFHKLQKKMLKLILFRKFLDLLHEIFAKQ